MLIGSLHQAHHITSCCRSICSLYNFYRSFLREITARHGRLDFAIIARFPIIKQPTKLSTFYSQSIPQILTNLAFHSQLATIQPSPCTHASLHTFGS